MHDFDLTANYETWDVEHAAEAGELVTAVSFYTVDKTLVTITMGGAERRRLKKQILEEETARLLDPWKKMPAPNHNVRWWGQPSYEQEGMSRLWGAIDAGDKMRGGEVSPFEE